MKTAHLLRWAVSWRAGRQERYTSSYHHMASEIKRVSTFVDGNNLYYQHVQHRLA